jgi:anti-sigma regulatory factor (Ser/Thr protein kinase)
MVQAEWSVESVFLPNATSIAAAREFVRGHLLRHDLLHLVDDVRLVVSELATNAMVHARTPFTVTLTGRRDGSVLLTVRDESSLSPAHTAAGELDTTGRGLSIVDHVSSEWGVTPAGDAPYAKAVWASFQTHRRGRSKASDRPSPPTS